MFSLCCIIKLMITTRYSASAESSARMSSFFLITCCPSLFLSLLRDPPSSTLINFFSSLLYFCWWMDKKATKPKRLIFVEQSIFDAAEILTVLHVDSLPFSVSLDHNLIFFLITNNQNHLENRLGFGHASSTIKWIGNLAPTVTTTAWSSTAQQSFSIGDFS